MNAAGDYERYQKTLTDFFRKREMITAVKEKAVANQETNFGWSEIVECYSDDEIADELLREKCSTVAEALAHFDWLTDLRSERYQEFQSEVF